MGIANLHPSQWSGITMDHWWRIMTNGGSNREGIASLTLLVTWEIWNERNARVFRNKFGMVVLEKIGNEARLWVIAGMKRLGGLMPGE
jgi:hypothetical protein